MAQIQTDAFVGEFLEHYGVKGMKWGKRRSRAERLQARAEKTEAAKKVTVETKPGGRGLKATGGKGRDASEDAIKAAVGKQIAKKSGVDALSNQELQAVVQRMNLEQQYAKLSKGQQSDGQKFMEKWLKDSGQGILNDVVEGYVKKKT